MIFFLQLCPVLNLSVPGQNDLRRDGCGGQMIWDRTSPYRTIPLVKNN
jgi:hypothetical protein